MQHPQVNPSLTPFGFAFGREGRLKPLSQNRVNGDREAALLWAQVNRSTANNPLPAQVIVHEIMPGIATIGKTTAGDFIFQGKPYLSRDIAIISSVIQWLGCNCGQGFLSDNAFMPKSFVRRYEEYRRNKRIEDNHFIHICTVACQHCFCVRPEKPSRRDKMVIKAVMV